LNGKASSNSLFRIINGAVPQLIALGLGLFAASIFMLAAGFNPINVFATLLAGALTTGYGQSSVLSYGATYILTALAFLIPGKAGIWNVGGNGQVFLGGITAALVVVFLPLPPGLWVFTATLAACLAGGLWAVIPGLLEAYRNASSIVTTIMLNFVAVSLSSYLLRAVIGQKVPSVGIYLYAPISGAATIPNFPGLNTSIMIVVAILVAGSTMYFLHRTTLGYNIRATGLGQAPAEAKGINPRTTRVLAMALGGAVAGLAGAGDVLGIGHGCGTVACYNDGFANGWFNGEGFAGIAVALVAANNPLGAILSAVFFAILVSGAAAVGAAGLTAYLFFAVQGIIILFMAAPYVSTLILKRR
jgi:simple sugar transport system permease protein